MAIAAEIIALGTPLVDVVLVLLIVFMVVTPLLTHQAWMNVPPVPQNEVVDPPPDAPPPVVVTLDSNGKIRINSELVDSSELASRVQGMLNARAEKIVFFVAASKTLYEKALEVLDTLKGGGMDTLAVLADAGHGFLGSTTRRYCPSMIQATSRRRRQQSERNASHRCRN